MLLRDEFYAFQKQKRLPERILRREASTARRNVLEPPWRQLMGKGSYPVIFSAAREVFDANLATCHLLPLGVKASICFCWCPLSRKLAKYNTVKTRFWSWLSGKSQHVDTCCGLGGSSARNDIFLFFTLVAGPRRSLSLKLSDTRVYAPQIRARLSKRNDILTEGHLSRILDT